MSSNPSGPKFTPPQPATLAFIVLVLILGALLLASNGIDPQAAVRASISPTPTVIITAPG
ncbi:MAG: hypothetical protein ACYDBJ_06985 [Aggregatilineales bacterium]